jgi:prepilin-type N-terminal cleavage/methylation domain-containing protein
MKRKRGFSVIEMLITMAVMGLVLVLGLRIGRSTIQKASITAAINAFVADFNYARSLAARENRYVAMVFNDEGTSYTIRIQKLVSLDPQFENSYKDQKTASPMNGDPCFTPDENFAVNSTGVIRKYPVDPNSNPITISMKFFKTRTGVTGSSPTKDYEKTVTIFPTGGIKIEN